MKSKGDKLVSLTMLWQEQW